MYMSPWNGCSAKMCAPVSLPVSPSPFPSHKSTRSIVSTTSVLVAEAVEEAVVVASAVHADVVVAAAAKEEGATEAAFP